ncbi:MAG: tol-pal system protein YbgF [Comamonadaceae bacterium]
MFRSVAALLLLCLASASASAGLFDDEEARKAILDLRQRVESVRQSVEVVRTESEQGVSRNTEDGVVLRRSLLDLQNQIETLRSELAKLRGMNEQLSRDLAEMQRRQKDIVQGVDDRLRQFEPVKVAVDGREFAADPTEKRDFEAALAIFRKGDFSAAQTSFLDFFKRFPLSGYGSSALFWLGNAQYATRDYKEAMINFRALVTKEPEHLRSPEAVLSIANCQIELKDSRGAKKTLEDLIKAYPQSEAAVAAKDRLSRIK